MSNSNILEQKPHPLSSVNPAFYNILWVGYLLGEVFSCSLPPHHQLHLYCSRDPPPSSCLVSPILCVLLET
ncbi:hypothetical protein GDO81_027963 [Engystomops pustulosus]|uniref:Uncharacterized protein n=1 Tax=Engystomops pustulosus TaxID=76066 RepID=A0AAV6YER9_ENGPU|nr:hypothetical protein GDO81_027963 [Engystomops pustulosus]